jgi:hypothetical protein
MSFKDNLYYSTKTVESTNLINFKGTFLFGLTFFYNNEMKVMFIKAIVNENFPIKDSIFYLDAFKSYDKSSIEVNDEENKNLLIARYGEYYKNKIFDMLFLAFTGKKIGYKIDLDGANPIEYKFTDFEHKITTDGSSIVIIGLDNVKLSMLVHFDDKTPLFDSENVILKESKVIGLECQYDLF